MYMLPIGIAYIKIIYLLLIIFLLLFIYINRRSKKIKYIITLEIIDAAKNTNSDDIWPISSISKTITTKTSQKDHNVIISIQTPILTNILPLNK